MPTTGGEEEEAPPVEYIRSTPVKAKTGPTTATTPIAPNTPSDRLQKLRALREASREFTQGKIA